MVFKFPSFWTMIIERDQFDVCCLDIVRLSETLQDNFCLHRDQDGNIYLSKESLKNVMLAEKNDDLASFEVTSVECDNMEKPASSSSDQYISFVHHIFYSESYNVPLMYFSASKQSGEMVSLEEIWKLVPSVHRHALREKWSLITQQEHPFLGCIVYHLHPCHTSSLMEKLSSHGTMSNYVLTWLSAIGPLVNIDVPRRFFAGRS